jgi:hypothetical protein
LVVRPGRRALLLATFGQAWPPGAMLWSWLLRPRQRLLLPDEPHPEIGQRHRLRLPRHARVTGSAGAGSHLASPFSRSTTTPARAQRRRNRGCVSRTARSSFSR